MPRLSAIEDPTVFVSVLSDIGKGVLSCRSDASTAVGAASLISRLFGLTHVMVLRLLPAGDAMQLEGGMGWEADTIGRAVFATDPRTLTGFALVSPEPVVVGNFQTDTRFVMPAPLLGYGFASCVCIRIPCEYQSSGVLAVFSTEPRSFSQDELSCLRVVAGMLVVSGGCQRTREVRREDQQRIEQAKQEWEATVDALPHIICLVDEQRRVVRANRSLEQWLPEPVLDVRGYTLHELLHPMCDDPFCHLLTLCSDTWDDVLKGHHRAYEVEDRVLRRYLEIQLRPATRRSDFGAKFASLVVVVLQDITRIKFAEAVLKNSKDELERLVQARTTDLTRSNDQLRAEIVQRQRIEQELRHSENEMRLLSAQVLTAQEMERKRIASELHDSIGQSLSAIKFGLENVIGLRASHGGDQDAVQIRRLIPRIQAAIDEVRRISMDLRPSTLDDLGVIPTIAWFCREFGEIYKDIQLDTQIGVAESDVSVPLKTAIYRILQEALNNVVRHASAGHVRIQLLKTDSGIELLVRDNGTGFDATARAFGKMSNKGFGIAGMRERAEFSGGTFSITSQSSTGTLVRVCWPCQQRSELPCPSEPSLAIQSGS